ncbi:SpaA isopeptide-forming pilin-related protein [Erysipelothrix rhusiopathiae]|uniref:SpaA isopeptide-forming pilin-related protein n=1 Tax=Erysipelothrix rhusiopathiae TaxID=1648 RepID=UPI0029547482|nr:SpaA isopeptide-forming pilin-related protein [Erysipelothrix rhusiopathiae]MDV7680385.1 hypothetical protein [Erysipelothrix rhusiopathiae]
MGKNLSVALMAFLVFISSGFIAPVYADNPPEVTETEYSEMKDAFDYSIVLSGYHSARQSFVTGPVAVRRDSSLPTNLMSFTYGAEASLSLVENAKPLALLIGGRVRNLNAHVQPQIQKTNISGQLINSKLVTDDFTWPDQVFKNADGTPSLGAEQKSYLPTSRTTELFLGFDKQVKLTSDTMKPLVESLGQSNGKTLGGKWVNGKQVKYDIQPSQKNAKILVVNIEPNEKGEVLISDLGFDYESVINNKNIEQVIITSYRMVQGKPEYAKKVIHHSNFMSNKGGAEHTLPSGSSEIAEHGAKIIHYMPEATQLTDFYNDKNQNGDFFAPRGISVMHSGLDVDGSLHLDSDEISKENNIISYDDVFGTIFAPKASVVLSGANVYGQIFAVDYHQRGNNTHVFIPNTWLSSMIPPQTDNLHTIQIQKVDQDDPNHVLAGSRITLGMVFGNKLKYYRIRNNVVDWVEDVEDAAVLETGTDGLVAFPRLIPSTRPYYVIEMEAPTGYDLGFIDEEVIVDPDHKGIQRKGVPVIITQSSGRVIETHVYNKKTPKPKVLFNINKHNQQGDLLNHAGFLLFKIDKNHRFYYSTSSSSSETVWTQEADEKNVLFTEQGRFNTDLNLEVGTYYLQEIIAPEGHVLNSTIREITLSEQDNPHMETILNQQMDADNQLHLSKVGVEDDDSITPFIAPLWARFKLYNMQTGRYYAVKDQNVVWTVGTDPKAVIETDGLTGDILFKELPKGDYVLLEVETSQGYVVDTQPRIIHIENAAVTPVEYQFENYKKVRTIYGTIAIEKVDASNPLIKLQGAQFVLTKNDEHGDTYYYTISNQAVKWVKSTTPPADAIVETNEKGKAVFIGVEPNQDYQVQEVKAPDGYEGNVTVDITKADFDDQLATVPLVVRKTVTNTKTHTSRDYSFIKVDERDQPLSGASFLLYNMIDGTRNYYRGDGTWTEDRNQADPSVSTPSGIVTFNDVPLGNYFIQEVEAPLGYETATYKESITITDKDDTLITRQVLNHKEADPITPGTQYHALNIYKVDAADDTKLLQDAVLRLSRKGQGTTWYYHQDDYGFVTWRLDPSEGTVMNTDAKGFTQFSQLEAGTYELEELKAPQGYELLRNPVSIVVEDGVTSGDTSFVLKNTKQEDPMESFDLLLVKRDAQTYKTLKGAEFGLYRIHEGQKEYYQQDGSWSKDIATWVSDASGSIQFEKLAQDTYWLKELAAPQGYQRLTDPVEVTLTRSMSMDVLNTKATSEVPQTPHKPQKPEISVPSEKLPATGITPKGIWHYGIVPSIVGGLLLWINRKQKKKRNFK